jgi:acyl carrier protein
MNDVLSEKDSKIVVEILIENLDVQPAQLTNEARLMEDLGADSLTMIEINMALEERFNLSFSDERLERVQTVGDIFELLAEGLQPRGAR